MRQSDKARSLGRSPAIVRPAAGHLRSTHPCPVATRDQAGRRSAAVDRPNNARHDILKEETRECSNIIFLLNCISS